MQKHSLVLVALALAALFSGCTVQPTSLNETVNSSTLKTTTTSIQPYGGGFPDLVMNSSVHALVLNVGQGSGVSFATENVGDAGAGASTTRVVGPGAHVSDYSITSLSAGDSQVNSVQIRCDSAGVFNVVASADFFNQVAESNETNNNDTLILTCVSPTTTTTSTSSTTTIPLVAGNGSQGQGSMVSDATHATSFCGPNAVSSLDGSYGYSLMDYSGYSSFSKADCDALGRLPKAFSSFQNGYCFFIQDVNVTRPSNGSSWLSFDSSGLSFNVNWTATLASYNGAYYPWSCVPGNPARQCSPVSNPQNVTSIESSLFQAFSLFSDHASSANVQTVCVSTKTNHSFTHYLKQACPLDGNQSFHYWLVSPNSVNEETGGAPYNCTLSVNEGTSRKLALNFAYNENPPNPWNPVPLMASQLTLPQLCDEWNKDFYTTNDSTNILGSYCFSFKPTTHQNNRPDSLFIDASGRLQFFKDWNMTRLWADQGESGISPVMSVLSNTTKNASISIWCIIDSTQRSYNWSNIVNPAYNLDPYLAATDHMNMSGAFGVLGDLNPYLHFDFNTSLEMDSNQTCHIQLSDQSGELDNVTMRYTHTGIPYPRP